VTEVLSPLIARLKRSEGWSDSLYLDTTSNLTIGWGFNLAKLVLPPGVKLNQVRIVPVNTISQNIGELLLLGKVAEVQHLVTTRVPWTEQMDDIRREVLVELVFEIGPAVLGYDGFMGQLKSRDYRAAAQNMRGWLWYAQVHAARAEPLCRQMESGARA